MSVFLCQTIESSPRGENQGEEVTLSQLVCSAQLPILLVFRPLAI